MSDTTQGQAPEGPTITISDLQNVLVLIDLASNRGTFRGAELASVGALYERIQTFVQAISPPVQVSTDQPAGPVEE